MHANAHFVIQLSVRGKLGTALSRGPLFGSREKGAADPSTTGLRFDVPPLKIPIRNSFQIRKVADGYQLACDIEGGYEHKLVLFPKESPRAKKLVASFTVEAGTCGVGFRPADLSPKGIGIDLTTLKPRQKNDVELWVEGDLAKCLLNGKPVMIPKRVYRDAYFCFTPSRRTSIVFHDLHFEPR